MPASESIYPFREAQSEGGKELANENLSRNIAKRAMSVLLALSNNGGRDKKFEQFFSDINDLFVVFNPPKILNDALEATIVAVFIDSCFNLQSSHRLGR
ncbi:hypothetical protein PCANC_27190 [Puccinia coronata f. sp. avenae]|uniref:Uncharacterized protein n=1 Tax=Puccinia coronata f. sp. avenae TaxID=200324 RepID=A0A2N5TH52_9BASI|nr:hypothetical protein PCANC_27190 [Puccinia coronata f. sp. avenae]